MRRTRSTKAFRRARNVLVGGVDSPVRSFQAVGGSPVFFADARGAYLVDVDGNRYLDLVNSWGATILGPAPPAVQRAVGRAARRGLSYGAPAESEHRLAEEIRRAAPEVERIRFVSSGTEAVMSAVRVARGFTGRPKVLKFEGGYHGHSDGLLARAGSGVATHTLPDSAGIPPSIVAETLVAPYNDLAATARVFEEHPGEIAAVLVEPVAGNMSVIPPEPGFLAGLSRLCSRDGALLIADEVITGFRLRRGLYHTTQGARADLVTLGKVIGGGLPIGAYGGRKEVMAQLAPEGPVYQAGTLAGHPLAMAAGAATLQALSQGVYDRIERNSRAVASAVTRATADDDGFHLTRVGSMLGLFFGDSPPRNYAEAARVNRRRYAQFFHRALDAGIYLPPSPLETTFVSAAITPRDVAHLARGLRGASPSGRSRA